MKIRVLRENGQVGLVEFDTPPTGLIEGKWLDRLVVGDIDYFFTKDGYFDGWGRDMTCAWPSR